MAFYLRGLIDYTLGYGLSYSTLRIGEFKEDVGDGSLKDQTDRLLHSLRGEEVPIVRKFGAVVSGNFSEVREKCSKALEDGSSITNVAVWLGQMVPAAMGKLPKFGTDEKLILELEYSMQHPPKGYEAGIALRRFIESGAIDPANILYIVLGDFIDHTEENVLRKHGLIPAYGDLSVKEQEVVTRLAAQKDLTVEEYIIQSNTRSKEQEQEVLDIAAEYGITVVEGGKRRVSHGKYSLLAPSCVVNLEFNEADSSLTQTCLLRANAEVSRDLIVALSKMTPRFEVINPDAASHDLKGVIDQAKIIPLTSSAASFAVQGTKEVVVGNPIDVAKLAPDQIVGKGIVVCLPMIKGGISSSEQLSSLQLSQNYANAEFIILMMRIPAEYGADQKTMMEDRNANYLKLITDLKSDGFEVPPIFISSSSVEAEYFPPFVHVVNLEKMLPEKPRSFVEAAQAGKYGRMTSLGGANEI